MRYKRESYLFVAYFFANVFMLVNNGVFWDDWTVFKMESAGLEQQFGENGFGFMVHVHRALNGSIYSPLLYHWLSFFLLFGTYMFVLRILKQFSIVANSAFLITLLAMLAPYFETKNLMICMPYALFLFSFCWGLYLVLGYHQKRRGPKTLVAGILLLFFSFFLNSLIPIFLCVYTLFFLASNDFSISKIRGVGWRELLLHIGIFVLPFVFWVFKKAFFPVKGLYASSGYNEIDFSLKKVPLQLKKVFTDNVVGIYDEFARILEYDIHFGIFAALASVAVCALVLRRFAFEAVGHKNVLRYVLVGALFFIVGVFPYLVVNKLPKYIGYETRHQILLSIGVAFFTYGLILVLPLFLRKTIYFIFLSAFMVNTVGANINFLRGWMKMEAVQQDIKNLDMGEGGIILTEGFDGQLNATENALVSYEVAGIFKKTLGRQDWLFVDHKAEKTIPGMLPGISKHPIKFNIKDYKTKGSSSTKKLNVKYNRQKIGYLDVLRLTRGYYVEKDIFELKIDSILNLEIK